MSDQQSKTEAEALVKFLEICGDRFLSWRDGSIVIETYYDKKFRALGGDTNRLISFFEDYCNMTDAARHYVAEIRLLERLPNADLSHTRRQ